MEFLKLVIENWDSIAYIIGLIAVFVLGLPSVKALKTKAMIWTDDHNLGKLAEVVSGVVARIYVDTVRIAKANGEWDNTMKRQVLDRAVSTIKEAAKREGIPVIKEMIPGMVEWAINRAKGSAPKKPLSAVLPGSLPVSQLTPLSDGPELPRKAYPLETADGL